MKRAVEKGFERGELAFVNGYEITYRPTRDEWYSRLPADAKASIPRLHAAIQEDEPSDATLRELEGLVEKHPYAPVFYNYLTVVYSRRGRHEQAERTIDRVLERFPDYIFARLNRAEKLLIAGDADGALALLGPQLELRGLYPGRKRYHVSEFASYYCTVAHYELKGGNRDRAESILDLLWEAAPHDRATLALAKMLGIPALPERLARLLGG
ncbi:MAG TPA: hypothetical protein VLK84_07590 [Longimicrobium sp.]|nr:hypothetical protein [Longimicrobium sp.]